MFCFVFPLEKNDLTLVILWIFTWGHERLLCEVSFFLNLCIRIRFWLFFLLILRINMNFSQFYSSSITPQHISSHFIAVKIAVASRQGSIETRKDERRVSDLAARWRKLAELAFGRCRTPIGGGAVLWSTDVISGKTVVWASTPGPLVKPFSYVKVHTCGRLRSASQLAS